MRECDEKTMEIEEEARANEKSLIRMKRDGAFLKNHMKRSEWDKHVENWEEEKNKKTEKRRRENEWSMRSLLKRKKELERIQEKREDD